MTSRLLSWTSVAVILISTNACNAKEPAQPGGQAVPKVAVKSVPNSKSPRITSKVDVSTVSQMSEKEAREVAFAANRILRHVALAREDIESKKHDKAAHEVDQATRLVQIIDDVLPHYKLKTNIKSSKHSYQAEEVVTPRYITLFQELDQVDLVTPIARAKKEVAANFASKSGGQARQAKSVVPIVSADDLDYTTIRFDFLLAKKMLKIANADLKSGQHSEHLKADTALRTLQAGGVLFEYDEVNQPLKQVADNLKLAEDELQRGRHVEANDALKVAADELKRYEKSVGENRAKEVKLLHGEITKLTATLEKGKPTDAEAKQHAASIAKFWNRVTKWFKKK